MSAGEADGEASVATGSKAAASPLPPTTRAVAATTAGVAVTTVAGVAVTTATGVAVTTAGGAAAATAVTTQTRVHKQGRVPSLWAVLASAPLSGSVASSSSSGALAFERTIFFSRQTRTHTPREKGRETASLPPPPPVPPTPPAGRISSIGRRRAVPGPAGKDGSSSRSSSRRTGSSARPPLFREPSSPTKAPRRRRIVSRGPVASRAGRSLTSSSGKERAVKRTPGGTKTRGERTSSKERSPPVKAVRTKTRRTARAAADKASSGEISLILSDLLRPRTGANTRVSSTATIASLPEEETSGAKVIIGERERVSPPLPLLSPPLLLPPPPPPAPPPAPPPLPLLSPPLLPPRSVLTPSWPTGNLPTITLREQDSRNWPTPAHPSPPSSAAKTSRTQEGRGDTHAVLSAQAGNTFNTRSSETSLFSRPRATFSAQSSSSPAAGASGTALFTSSGVYLSSYVHTLEAHFTDFETSSTKPSPPTGGDEEGSGLRRHSIPGADALHPPHGITAAASLPSSPSPPPRQQTFPPSASPPRVKAFARPGEKVKGLTKVNTQAEVELTIEPRVQEGRSRPRLPGKSTNDNSSCIINSCNSNHSLAPRTTILLRASSSHLLSPLLPLSLLFSSTSSSLPPRPPAQAQLFFSGRRARQTITANKPGLDKGPSFGEKEKKLSIETHIQRRECIHLSSTPSSNLHPPLSPPSVSPPLSPSAIPSPSSSFCLIHPLTNTLTNKISNISINSYSVEFFPLPVVKPPKDSPAGFNSPPGPSLSPKTHWRQKLVAKVELWCCSPGGGSGCGSGEDKLAPETDFLDLSTRLTSTSASPPSQSIRPQPRPPPPLPLQSLPPCPTADGEDEGEQQQEEEAAAVALVEGDVSHRCCEDSCRGQGTDLGGFWVQVKSSKRPPAVTGSSPSLEELVGSSSGSSRGAFSPSRSSFPCASYSPSSSSCLPLPFPFIRDGYDSPNTLRFNTWGPRPDEAGNGEGQSKRSEKVAGHWSSSSPTAFSSCSLSSSSSTCSSTSCASSSSSSSSSLFSSSSYASFLCFLTFPYWVILVSCLVYAASMWLKSSLLKTLHSLMHSSYADVPPQEMTYSTLPTSKSSATKSFLKTFTPKSSCPKSSCPKSSCSKSFCPRSSCPKLSYLNSSSPKSSCSESTYHSRSSRLGTTLCPRNSSPAVFTSKSSYPQSSCSKSPCWIPSLAAFFLTVAILISGGVQALQIRAPFNQRTQDLSQEEVIDHWNSAAAAQVDDEGTLGVWGWVRETTKTDFKNLLDHEHLLLLHHQHPHHHQEQDLDHDDKTVHDDLMTFATSGASPHQETLNHFFKYDSPRSFPSHSVSFVTSHATSYANLSYSTPTASRRSRRARSVCGLGEVECGDGSCMASDQYCDGEADCSDGADEPSHCSPCGRIYYGSVGKTYEILLHWPREARRPPQCNLTLVAAGDSHGDLVQLAFHEFTLGKFHSHKDRGCPHGHMQVVENQRKYRPGFWCGGGSSLALYYSETPSVSVILTNLPTDNDLTALDAFPSFYLRMTFKFLRREDAVARYGLPRKPKYLGLRNPSTMCNANINNCDSHTCYLQSPNFPGMYPRNTTCYYHLRQTRQKPGHRAVIALRQDSPHLIHIKSQPQPSDSDMRHLKLYEECYYVGDYVRIYDGDSTQSPVLITFCRGGSLPEIISSGPNMLIEFTTSPYDTPLHKSPWSYVSGFELQARTKFIPLEDLYPKCHLVLDSKKNLTGFVKNVEHSLPPNTTCVYEFRGHGRQVVWLYFIKYVQIHNINRLQTLLCSTKLDIVDGRWSPKPDTEMRILGQHCKNSEPRMCDRGFRELQNKDVRPCTVEESYVSSGNNMTVVQLYGEGSVITDVRFLLKYEFVDVSLPGEEVEAPCAQVIKSDGYSHSIRNLTTPRNVFLYGRGGSPKLHCSFTLQAMKHEVVRLTISHLKTTPASRCTTGIHHETEAKECITTAGPHIALRITEYPWTGVAYPRACICSSDAVPFTLESSSSVLQLNISVTGMKPHEDYRHFGFVASYEFTKKPPCLRTQRLDSSSGEITFESPSPTDHDRSCEGHPWLLTTPPGHQIYVSMDRATFANGTCASGTRLFFYRPNRGRLYRTVCPAANVEHNVHFFSQPRGNLTLEEMEEEEEESMGALTSRKSSLLLVYQPRSASQLSVKWLQVRPIIKNAGTAYEYAKVGANTEEDAGGWRQKEMVEEEGECKEFCPELDACIHAELWCDGQTHCPLGTDEMVSNCLLVRVPWLYLSIVSVTLLTLMLITASAVRRRRRQRAKKRQQAARRVSTQESILPKDNRLSAYSIDYTDMDFETTV